jgi:chromosome segregation ATPase
LSQAPLAARAIIFPMPAPTNERQSLERERAELPGQLARYQKELDATPPEQRERRERLAWQIRRIKKRTADLEARLAALASEG